MISANVRLSPSLEEKLKQSWIDTKADELTDAIAHATLENVKEYGIGVAREVLAFPNYDENDGKHETNRTPSGGSPIWQGEITEVGHYRGYLSESHRIEKVNHYQSRIVTPAEFVWGVIEGYSTNSFDSMGNEIRFPPNPYHKRAVDKMFSEGLIPTIWHNAVNK